VPVRAVVRVAVHRASMAMPRIDVGDDHRKTVATGSRRRLDSRPAGRVGCRSGQARSCASGCRCLSRKPHEWVLSGPSYTRCRCVSLNPLGYFRPYPSARSTPM
jgi:hypothetical protein